MCESCNMNYEEGYDAEPNWREPLPATPETEDAPARDAQPPVVEQVNWELLDQSIRYAILHPDQFDMKSWAARPEGNLLEAAWVNGQVAETVDSGYYPQHLVKVSPTACGTTACLAGTALLLKGYAFAARRDEWTDRQWDAEAGDYKTVKQREFYLNHEQMATPDGARLVYVAAAAAQELGISDHVQYWLKNHSGHYVTLFYGGDVHDVIEFRNELARRCGVDEDDFRPYFDAAKLYEQVNAAFGAGEYVRRLAVAHRERAEREAAAEQARLDAESADAQDDEDDDDTDEVAPNAGSAE